MAVAVREQMVAYPWAGETRLNRAELATFCRHMEDRLLRGQEHIYAARAAGQDVRGLEQRWRELLRAYERASLLLSRHA